MSINYQNQGFKMDGDETGRLDRSFLESEVFNGLRVWHISGDWILGTKC